MLPHMGAKLDTISQWTGHRCLLQAQRAGPLVMPLSLALLQQTSPLSVLVGT